MLFALTAGRGQESSVMKGSLLTGDFAALHEIIVHRKDYLHVLPAFCLLILFYRPIQLDLLNSIIPGQVAVLQEERNSLLAENDVLTDRANQLDTFDDPNTPSGRKHSQLQQQLELLQEENFRCVLFC